MSGITLDTLLFDPNNPGDAPIVGSHLLASDGSLINDTSGDLHVLIQNASVVVSATDLDIRDLSASQDNVAISDGTDTLAINADGSINTTITATDLDIRDLSHTQDSVQIGDGTDLLAINADGSINVNLTDDGVADNATDSGNPFKVGWHAYDGALTAVDADDRVNGASDLYRRLFINSSPNIGLQTSAASVTTSAAELASTPLAGRMRLLVQNRGNRSIFIGGSSVSTSNGVEVPKGASMELPFGEDVDIYAVCASGTQDVRILEVA